MPLSHDQIDDPKMSFSREKYGAEISGGKLTKED